MPLLSVFMEAVRQCFLSVFLSLSLFLSVFVLYPYVYTHDYICLGVSPAPLTHLGFGSRQGRPRFRPKTENWFRRGGAGIAMSLRLRVHQHPSPEPPKSPQIMACGPKLKVYGPVFLRAPEVQGTTFPTIPKCHQTRSVKTLLEGGRRI